jgi:predicted RecB family nuclease
VPSLLPKVFGACRLLLALIMITPAKMKSSSLISATDLVNFTRCRHFITLMRRGVAQEEPEEDSELFARKGEEHERAFCETRSPRFEVTQGTPAEKMEATVRAMQEGFDWIYHGFLFDSSCRGEIDFLRKISVPSPHLGTYSYEVWDTKLGKRPKAEHVLQLCHYSELLAKVQGQLPEAGVIVAGDFSEHRYVLSDYLFYYRNLSEQYQSFLRSEATTSAYPIAFCNFCPFRGHCEEEWKRTDNVALTLGIRRRQVSALNRVGVHSIKELSVFEPSSYVRQKGLSSAGLTTLIRQARAQTSGKLEVLDRKKLRDIPPPATGDLFFDMESDPLMGEQGLEYLFGIWVREKGKADRFECFWALDPSEEKLAFERTIDFFWDFKDKHPEMRIYHYGAYETTHLAHLASRHATEEDRLDDLLREGRFVDLYGLARKSLILPVTSLSLKKLESLFGFQREGEVKAAASSIVFFEKWLISGEKQYLEAIEAYNQMDVRATAALYDWMRGLA